MADGKWQKRLRSILATFHLLLATALPALLSTGNAHAATLIRDAEIEHALRAYGEPIFKQAGLNPAAVRIFIVQDAALNAYVAGGQNIFLHTGLIDACETPAMLLGVIAHETGHIAGGHIARGAEQLRSAQIGSILGYVLGTAAMIGGSGEAGMAVISGSQSMLQRSMLSHSRAQESAADQAALSYLDALHISAQGMAELFAVLKRDEQRAYGNIDPYAITHPMSADRIQHVRAHVENSGIPPGKTPAAFDAMHARIRAKLYAFLEMPPKTFARYPAGDKSPAARLARAVAWYKIPEIDKALAEIGGLIKDYPADPFFYDLQGQILFENGRLKEARAAYAKAAQLAPDSPLILSALGEAEIALKDAKLLGGTIARLNKAAVLDNSNSHVWRLLATAYGRQGDKGMAALALAEEAALGTQPQAVARQAEEALKYVKPGTPASLRAEDLKRLAAQMKEDAKKR